MILYSINRILITHKIWLKITQSINLILYHKYRSNSMLRSFNINDVLTFIFLYIHVSINLWNYQFSDLFLGSFDMKLHQFTLEFIDRIFHSLKLRWKLLMLLLVHHHLLTHQILGHHLRHHLRHHLILRRVRLRHHHLCRLRLIKLKELRLLTYLLLEISNLIRVTQKLSVC